MSPLFIPLIGTILLIGWFLGWLVFHRLYPRTLRFRDEKKIIDEIVADMAFAPHEWNVGSHHIGNQKWKIWIANERFADMNIEEPMRINTSIRGASRLRNAKKRLMMAKAVSVTPGNIERSVESAFKALAE